MKTRTFHSLFSKLTHSIHRQQKPVLIACITLIVMAIAALCIKLLPRQPEEPRYALETGGGEINFHAPDIQIHTAADGVAVIGISGDDENIIPVTVPGVASAPPDLAPSETEPASPAPEAPAPVNMMEAATTHSGFSMPVAMEDGSIGVLTIPDLGLSVRVYESDDDMADMEKGAAHFKSTSAWMGNIGLSAHNIALNGTPGYFMNLHTLAPGAVISYETAHGVREYIVENIVKIEEADWSMLGRTDDNRITLITCISGKPELRLCVQGVERTRNEE